MNFVHPLRPSHSGANDPLKNGRTELKLLAIIEGGDVGLDHPAVNPSATRCFHTCACLDILILHLNNLHRAPHSPRHSVWRNVRGLRLLQSWVILSLYLNMAPEM